MAKKFTIEDKENRIREIMKPPQAPLNPLREAIRRRRGITPQKPKLPRQPIL